MSYQWIGWLPIPWCITPSYKSSQDIMKWGWWYHTQFPGVIGIGCPHHGITIFHCGHFCHLHCCMKHPSQWSYCVSKNNCGYWSFHAYCVICGCQCWHSFHVWWNDMGVKSSCSHVVLVLSYGTVQGWKLKKRYYFIYRGNCCIVMISRMCCRLLIINNHYW